MRMASVGVLLLLGICLTVLAVACEEGGEKATATPTAAATATAIPTPTLALPTSIWPPAVTPTPGAAPAASPTPEVAACPDDDPAFCAFAAQVEQAIADEDADFFVANSLTQSVLCTA